MSREEHLKRLVDVIRSCGVSFSVWEKRNADSKGSGMWDWTSLMGDDRKKLLRELPPKLEIAIQPDTAQIVVQLWRVTYYIAAIDTKLCSDNMNSLNYFVHLILNLTGLC